MPGRTALLLDEASSKVGFGGQRIVGRAAQGQVGSDVPTSFGERLQMVELQIARLATTLTARIDKAAAPRITRENLSLHRRWHMRPALANKSGKRFTSRAALERRAAASSDIRSS